MANKGFFNPSSQKKRLQRAYIFLFIIAIFLSLILIVIIPDKDISSTREAGGSKEEEQITENTEKSLTEERNTSYRSARILRGRIAIIIDDVGYNLKSLKPFLDFPGKLTLAVLPQVTYSRQAAQMIHDANKEVILHLPMEPEGNYDPGPGVITVDMEEEEIRSILKTNFDSVPYARGANNHMGSLATADQRIMDIVIAYFKEQGKFFIDSKTTPDSLVGKYAELYGIKWMERNVFIEDSKGRQSIIQGITEGMKIAEKYGYALLIGHVQDPDIIQVLKEIYPDMIKKGFKLVTVYELLQSEE